MTMALLYPEQINFLDFQEMQQTHEDEIAILNDIENLATKYQMKQIPVDALEVKLDAYLVHVNKHFSNEEVLMQKYGYPDYEMHKMAHDMFLADLKYAVNHWKNHGDIDKMIHFIRKTPEWLIMHVNGLDTDTASFLLYKTKKEAQK